QAELDLAQSLDAVGGSLEQPALQADQIPRQMDVEDLPPAVCERLAADRPARIERVELGLLLTGRDDLRARFEHQMIALHLVDEGELGFADRLEGVAPPQSAFETGYAHEPLRIADRSSGAHVK